jgi:hypothetical protein
MAPVTKERHAKETERATVWIRRDLHLAVKHVAVDERVSVGECLDRLIEEALEARRKTRTR